jgi:ABC-type transport system involved in cytochrome bd biosynthesis fused ATPase/permease subunit
MEKLAILTTVIDFGLNTYISNVETQISETLLVFGILSIVGVAVGYIDNITIRKYTTNLVLKFERTQIEKYASMDVQSKEKRTIGAFIEKLNRAMWAINSRYTWGISVATGVISSLVGFCYIVIKYKQYTILLMFAVVHFCWYWFLTKDMMQKIDEKRTANRVKMDTLYDISSLMATRIHNNECSVDDYMKKKLELEYMNQEIDNYWTFVTSCQRLPNYIVVILIACFVDPKLYLVLYIICNNLSGSIGSALNFANQWKTSQNDIKGLEEFWDGKTFDMEYTQKNIPSYVSLSGYINNFLSIVEDKPLTVNQGDNIIISGVSGAGKTTLIKGMQGHVLGLNYDTKNHPLCYKDQIMYMSQNAREKLPTSRTTLRQLFYDEVSSKLITEALKIVQLTSWFTNTMESNLDKLIEEKLSGGEKTRLCLAIALYKARKNKVKWLILDEPDSGLEQKLSVALLKSAMDNFQDVTIFLIVHMCGCQLKHMGIKKEWNVANKEINELNV